MDFNLHEGTPQMRSDVRHLLCLLTKDNEHATMQLNEILISAVGEAVNSHKSNPAMVSNTYLYVVKINELLLLIHGCGKQPATSYYGLQL